jgi:hypothetical protein
MSKLNIDIPDELDQALRQKIRHDNKREIKKGDIRTVVIELIKAHVASNTT